MNWLTKLVRPKIKSLTHGKDVPDNLWIKCPQCNSMIFTADADKSLNVCQHCNYHMRIDIKKRLELLSDGGKYKREHLNLVKEDPLHFKDKKKYKDRISAAQTATGEKDSFITGSGTINGLPVVTAAFEFKFMGGSMGSVVGEKFVRAVDLAIERQTPFICFSASGGARMQEALFSLMQMAKTSAALGRLRAQGLPFISVLTDPTMGGVSASFAMLGDLNVAEPKALIGFAGPRVIEQTVREKLPEGFQRSEFLLEHGALDRIIHRHDLRNELADICKILQNKPA